MEKQKSMFKDYHLLMIDDHPTQLQAYQSVFELIEDIPKLIFTTFTSLEEAYQFVMFHESKTEIDLVLLDLSMPPYPEKNLHSGTDLAQLIQTEMPQAKLSFITSHHEALVLYDLYYAFHPAGILVKSDFTGEDLMSFLVQVIQGENYYTKSFLDAREKVNQSELFLDTYNRKIVLALAKGYPSKDLPELIGLSISSIDKRKASLKIFFNTEKQKDNYMILEARKMGLI